MDFATIFREYYTLYRGQATNLPIFGSPEYTIAINLANNAIRKWSRADGMLWRELFTTFQTVSAGTVVGASTTYPITNMRKPPAKVQFFSAGVLKGEYDVIEPQEIENYTSLNGIAYFTGSASSGYVLHLDGDKSQITGSLIDFVFLKLPTFFTTATTPAAQIPDMSDPNFIIQDMLASRAANSRNGFLYKTAKNEAVTALQNMKIENDSGTYGKSLNLLTNSNPGAGWGVVGSNDGLGRL